MNMITLLERTNFWFCLCILADMYFKVKSKPKYQDFPAVAIHAEYKNAIRGAHSDIKCNYCSEARLYIGSILGSIGKKSSVMGCTNLIGNCAEQKAYNKLVLKSAKNNATVNPKQIVFSKPRRPRTMEVVPMCGNCKKLFT